MPEHVLVAEKALGHYLDARHVIHHVDGDKTNNAPCNLVVCEDSAYHVLLHKRQRAFDACGDANAKRCQICHRYDAQHDILTYEHKSGRNVGSQMNYHRECRRQRYFAKRESAA